jgi:hypothetical protein
MHASVRHRARVEVDVSRRRRLVLQAVKKVDRHAFRKVRTQVRRDFQIAD